MRRRSRTRRVLKWVGTVACAAAAVGWGASYASPGFSLGNRASVMWSHGVFRLVADWRPSSQDVHFIPPVGGEYWPFMSAKGRIVYVASPFWALLAATSLPTVLLWWLDPPRHPPAHCQSCGYDLTGNVSGVCPECGTAVPAARMPKASG